MCNKRILCKFKEKKTKKQRNTRAEGMKMIQRQRESWQSKKYFLRNKTKKTKKKTRKEEEKKIFK